MSDQKVQSDLLVELSAENQENLAGGNLWGQAWSRGGGFWGGFGFRRGGFWGRRRLGGFWR